MGHRPMYCSNWDSDDCTKFESIVRTLELLIHCSRLIFVQLLDPWRIALHSRLRVGAIVLQIRRRFGIVGARALL